MTNTEETPRRSVELSRNALGRYTVRNARGVELEFGHGEDLLSPVELLLAAIGGCSAIDVDHITSKRSEPTGFDITVDAQPVTDDAGAHHLVDVAVDFRVRFPNTDAGNEAAAVVVRSLTQSRDRLCTVSRTVARLTPIEFRADGDPV